MKFIFFFEIVRIDKISIFNRNLLWHKKKIYKILSLLILLYLLTHILTNLRVLFDYHYYKQ